MHDQDTLGLTGGRRGDKEEEKPDRPPALHRWKRSHRTMIERHRRHDVISESRTAVEYTVVNSAVTWAEGTLTGAAAGQLLRS